MNLHKSASNKEAHTKRPLPGSLPCPLPYTAYFCEENIWQLCRHWNFQAEEAQVIFISNPTQQCPMWNMKAGDGDGQPVIWDYHVILITQAPLLVWDLDTCLALPISLATYLSASFHPYVADAFKPWFKVIDAAFFLAEFASNRSHMLNVKGDWLTPPPSWPIIGKNKPSNLLAFRDMTQPYGGEIYSFELLCQHYKLSPDEIAASSDFK